MRKLTLDFDQLAVETFVTGRNEGRGTVRAHDDDSDTVGTGCGCDSLDLYCAGGGSADGCGGGVRAATACGPCPPHTQVVTACIHDTCHGNSMPCFWTCGAGSTCMGGSCTCP